MRCNRPQIPGKMRFTPGFESSGEVVAPAGQWRALFSLVKAYSKRVREPEFIICGDQPRRDSLFVFRSVGPIELDVDAVAVVPKGASAPPLARDNFRQHLPQCLA